MKKLIKYVEEKPAEELKKSIYDLLNINYKILKKSYDGFLEFIVNKMHEKNDDSTNDKDNNSPKNINKDKL